MNKPVNLGLTKTRIKNYGYRQFHCIHKKQMMFIKPLPKMLKLDLILQTMNQIDHYPKENIKK